MIYLLDSNVWIGLIRRTSPVLAARFQALAPSADIRVCSVGIAELWYGCARSAKPAANRAALEALIAPFPSLPYDNAAADHFVLEPGVVDISLDDDCGPLFPAISAGMREASHDDVAALNCHTSFPKESRISQASQRS